MDFRVGARCRNCYCERPYANSGKENSAIQNLTRQQP
jgi:hypothetical protein